MIYEMKLFDRYFEKIKSLEKIYEVRLNDEKRKKIAVGDVINFNNFSHSSESISVRVKSIEYFSSIKEMINNVSLKLLGFENETVEEATRALYDIYTEEEEKRWGVILMEIKPIYFTNCDSHLTTISKI